MDLAEAAREVRRLSDLLEQGLKALRESGEDVAVAERDYRKAKSLAWVHHLEGTAREREAKVDAATADERYVRDIAEATRRAALESVRSRQTQITAIQTLLNAYRAEADFDRTGPR